MQLQTDALATPRLADLANDSAPRHDPDREVYLKAETKIEFLVGGWHAWAHLLSPAQYALNLAYRHAPALRSFIANPSVHAAAARDPKFIGSQFMQLSEADAPAARAFLESLTGRGEDLIAFAGALKVLDQTLQATGKGQGLDDLYAAADPRLGGFVELVYDLHHRPQLKLREEVLDAWGPDIRSFQEIRLLDQPDHARPFFMSTPRLPRSGEARVSIPFDDVRLDRLCAARTAPIPLGEIADLFGVLPEALGPIEAHLTDAPPRRITPDYAGPGVRVRYFGHACVLLQTESETVLIDPLVTWDRDEGEAGLTFADLPDRIDFLVLSHGHLDHCSPEILVQLRPRVGKVIVARNNAGSLADPSLKLILRRLGYRTVVVLDPLERVTLPEGEIVSLPFTGEHADLDIGAKQSILVRLRGRAFLFLVDSDNVDPALAGRLRDHLGEIDALFIGMECAGAPLSWLYGPLLLEPLSRQADNSRRLNGSDCERALRFLNEAPCAQVFVYAMGQESWLPYLMGLRYEPGSIQIVESDKFIVACRSRGVPAERLLGCREMFF